MTHLSNKERDIFKKVPLSLRRYQYARKMMEISNYKLHYVTVRNAVAWKFGKRSRAFTYAEYLDIKNQGLKND